MTTAQFEQRAPAERPTTDSASADARLAHTLDSLATLGVEQLTAVYERGWIPDSLADLDGTPSCRVLAAAGPLGRGRVAAALRRLARSERFPWAGKQFSATNDTVGSGINRFRLAGIREWFPFDTRIEPSALDGRPCVVLDYDRPANPWLVRRIRDELREVAHGVFLGPALWKTRSSPALVVYFACDHSGR